jgi:hypothetical protein
MVITNEKVADGNIRGLCEGLGVYTYNHLPDVRKETGLYRSKMTPTLYVV